MRINWNWRKFLPFIALVAAVIFILSGYVAHRMSPIDTEARPDGNGFSTAILVVIFVTIPAFLVLLTSIFVFIVDRLNQDKG